MTTKTLDARYRSLNSIYVDRNFYRSPESILAHLVEVVGGLSTVASGKKQPGVDPERFTAKVIGWWLALCGSVRLSSVQDVVWAKFPRVCPYCQLPQHSNKKCKANLPETDLPGWSQLKEIAKRDAKRMPSCLEDWRAMFEDIYEPDQGAQLDYTFSRLAEELGELSEAVRIVPVTRTYFLSEAADVFAWTMGVANVLKMKGLLTRSIDDIFDEEYPGECRECRQPICKCPPILPKTLCSMAQ